MKPFPQYSFLEKAAEEARAESRRHWAKGGYWDRKYPVQPCPDWWWPIGTPTDETLQERRHRRQGRR